MDVMWIPFHVILQVVLLWVSSCKGFIRCDCNTAECKDAGKSTCMAMKSCYAELFKNELNRGCDPTPLACDNRKPSSFNFNLEWPAVYCCNNKDLCNKYVIPTVSTPVKTQDDTSEEASAIQSRTSSNCSRSSNPDQGSASDGSSSSSSSNSSSSSTKIINPIYIAVPVAGVCVLLALIIFAMYLLRRRTDFHHHDSFHHYHHQHAPAMAAKPAVQHHHCQCMCKKQSVPSCSKGNRCTDSERSSSGSETKLFLQT